MGEGERPTSPLAQMVPLLVEVQSRLDADLNLGSLAREFGRSPHHFHRLFSAAIGETPRQHVHRMRLERAAYLLAITDDAILSVGLAVGFHSHETFSRAFRRRFGRSPSDYRLAAKANQRSRLERNRAFRGDGCRISEVRFESRRPMRVMSIRRVGPYADLDHAARAAVWDELTGWADRTGVACGPVRLGLFPDDPGMTPKSLQQCDLCIPIQGPMRDCEGVRGIELVGGAYAVIEHIGPHGSVDQAYRNLADGVRSSGVYAFTDGPPVHVYLPPGAGDDPGFERSQVGFPVRRKNRQDGPPHAR